MRANISSLKILILTIIISTFSVAADAQIRAYRVSDRDVQTLLNRIESRTNQLQTMIDRNLDRSNADGTRREDTINNMVADFETATDRLRTNFRDRRSTGADVEDVMSKAVIVNTFITNNNFPRRTVNHWNLIRADLDTLSNYYSVTSRWDTTIGTGTIGGGRWGYTSTDAQMRDLLFRLKQRATAFRQNFDRWNNRSYDRSAVDRVRNDITEFQRSLDDLTLNYNRRNARIDDLMSEAMDINSFVVNTRTNNNVTNSWNLVRSDLDTLARYYGTTSNWDGGTTLPGGNWGGSFDERLTGTYRLNARLSDNVNSIVDQAIRNASLNNNQEDRVRRNLERRLAAPETIVIQKRGNQVMLSTNNGQMLELNANGSRQTETNPNGRTVTTTVTSTNSDLTINYEGDRMNDYYIRFTPSSNGRLTVTRRIYLENQNTTVTSNSVYDRTSPSVDWNTTGSYPTTGTGSGFIVPNNTTLTATLDTPISTRTARDGDRFSMTVTSPGQFNGAIIEGMVTGERSGTVSGRANLSMNFNTIRLRNGQTYSFAGIVDRVQNVNGETVSVNNEGQIRDGSQTTRTVTRAGIGAALGALIGAIAGGGSGAAIGAGVGAGAGAGTVILQGRDNLELASGAQFTITATGPNNYTR